MVPGSTATNNNGTGRIIRRIHFSATFWQIRNSGESTNAVWPDDLHRRRVLVLPRGDRLAADDHDEGVVVVLEGAGVVVTEGDLLRGAVAATVSGQLFANAFDVSAATGLGTLAPGRPVGPLTTQNDVYKKIWSVLRPIVRIVGA